MPATLIEAILGGHTIAVRKNFRYVFILGITYVAWLVICFFVTGDWPYGFVAKMGVLPALLVLLPAFFAVAGIGLGLTKMMTSILPVALKTSLEDMNQNTISLTARKIE